MTKSSTYFSGVALKTSSLNQVRIQLFFFRYTFSRKMKAKKFTAVIEGGMFVDEEKAYLGMLPKKETVFIVPIFEKSFLKILQYFY